MLTVYLTVAVNKTETKLCKKKPNKKADIVSDTGLDLASPRGFEPRYSP
jgi:hypothetical protein